MKNGSNDINILEQQMTNNEDICCSCGIIDSFPKAFFDNYQIADVGIIVCTSGKFTLRCEDIEYVVNKGETAFLSHDVHFSVTKHSTDCSVVIILYRADSIRDILGITIVGMKFIEMLNPRDCWVMHTGHEDELTKYSELLALNNSDNNVFAANERRLLLLSLTYRLCNIFHEISKDNDNASSRKLEIYMQLIQLIDQYYTCERGVRFLSSLTPILFGEISGSAPVYLVTVNMLFNVKERLRVFRCAFFNNLGSKE